MGGPLAPQWATATAIGDGPCARARARLPPFDHPQMAAVATLSIAACVLAAGTAQAIQSSPKADDARLVAKVVMALDASGPIRHKGFASHIDGIGPTLAVVFQDDILRKQVEDLITSGILKQWLALQGRVKTELMNIYSLTIINFIIEIFCYLKRLNYIKIKYKTIFVKIDVCQLFEV